MNLLPTGPAPHERDHTMHRRRGVEEEARFMRSPRAGLACPPDSHRRARLFGSIDWHIDPTIAPDDAALLRRLATSLYPAIGYPQAFTTCIFTSLVIRDVLRALGRPAGVRACWLEIADRNATYAIGRPGRACAWGAWNGHAVCRMGDILIDGTVAQAKRWGTAHVPHLAAVRVDASGDPWGALDLRGGAALRWHPAGSGSGWTGSADTRPSLREGAVRRLLRCLPVVRPA